MRQNRQLIARTATGMGSLMLGTIAVTPRALVPSSFAGGQTKRRRKIAMRETKTTPSIDPADYPTYGAWFRALEVRHLIQRCESCGKFPSDPPSHLCPGCEAYQEHQR